MTQQPEALMLARALEGEAIPWMRHEVAAELRRLHQSEREGWRYAKELEARITTLEAALQRAVEALESMREAFVDVDGDHGRLERNAEEAADAAITTAKQALNK